MGFDDAAGWAALEQGLIDAYEGESAEAEAEAEQELVISIPVDRRTAAVLLRQLAAAFNRRVVRIEPCAVSSPMAEFAESRNPPLSLYGPGGSFSQ